MPMQRDIAIEALCLACTVFNGRTDVLTEALRQELHRILDGDLGSCDQLNNGDWCDLAYFIGDWFDAMQSATVQEEVRNGIIAARERVLAAMMRHCAPDHAIH